MTTERIDELAAEGRRRAMEERGTLLAEDLDIDLDSYHVFANLHWAFTFFKTHAERRVLSQFDLSLSAFVALWSIYVYGEMEASQLAEELAIARSSMSGLASRLETRGFIARRVHPKDGRAVLFRLTSEGEAVVRGAWPALNRSESELGAHLSVDEKRELAVNLRRLADQISRSLSDS